MQFVIHDVYAKNPLLNESNPGKYYKIADFIIIN